MKKIKIHTDFITLGQLLKICDFIASGGHAKMFLEENKVLVNNEPENRRGRKIYPGYEVEICNEKISISK